MIMISFSLLIGPAASLFQESYFQLLRQALKPGGIVCSQGENAWFHSHLISPLLNRYPKQLIYKLWKKES